ncbi:MAG: hypothetical protein ACKO6G_08825 [Vulcanococcus sp.]
MTPTRRRFGSCLALVAAPVLSGLALPSAALGDYAGQLSTQEQRIYDYGPGGSNGSSKSGSILDSTNPIDLMNKIRRGTAMDEATAPSDAIDAALKELEAQAPVSSTRPGSASAPLVKQP